MQEEEKGIFEFVNHLENMRRHFIKEEKMFVVTHFAKYFTVFVTYFIFHSIARNHYRFKRPSISKTSSQFLS
jgi:hypothetical protein